MRQQSPSKLGEQTSQPQAESSAATYELVIEERDGTVRRYKSAEPIGCGHSVLCQNMNMKVTGVVLAVVRVSHSSGMQSAERKVTAQLPGARLLSCPDASMDGAVSFELQIDDLKRISWGTGKVLRPFDAANPREATLLSTLAALERQALVIARDELKSFKLATQVHVVGCAFDASLCRVVFLYRMLNEEVDKGKFELRPWKTALASKLRPEGVPKFFVWANVATKHYDPERKYADPALLHILGLRKDAGGRHDVHTWKAAVASLGTLLQKESTRTPEVLLRCANETAIVCASGGQSSAAMDIALVCIRWCKNHSEGAAFLCPVVELHTILAIALAAAKESTESESLSYHHVSSEIDRVIQRIKEISAARDSVLFGDEKHLINCARAQIERHFVRGHAQRFVARRLFHDEVERLQIESGAKGIGAAAPSLKDVVFPLLEEGAPQKFVDGEELTEQEGAALFVPETVVASKYVPADRKDDATRRSAMKQLLSKLLPVPSRDPCLAQEEIDAMESSEVRVLFESFSKLCQRLVAELAIHAVCLMSHVTSCAKMDLFWVHVAQQRGSVRSQLVLDVAAAIAKDSSVGRKEVFDFVSQCIKQRVCPITQEIISCIANLAQIANASHNSSLLAGLAQAKDEPLSSEDESSKAFAESMERCAFEGSLIDDWATN